MQFTPQLEVKATANNNSQAHTQQGIGTAHKLVKNPGNRFLSSHKRKRKTKEQKERGILQPLIHQKKDKLELCIISLILYLKSNCKHTS